MPSANVANALGADVHDVAAALLTLPEDQWFDRKSIRIKPSKLAEAEVALANAEGGTLVIGLNDGVVEGISGSTSAINGLRQTALNFTTPPVHAKVHTVECIDSEGEPNQLLVIDVESSSTVHTTAGDDCFLRVGDQNRKLTYSQRQELHYDKGQSQFDGEVLTLSGEDLLEESIVADYARAVGSPDPRRVLQARGLTTINGNLTNAAYLLFGKLPQTHYPEAFVRVLRYRGLERGVGRQQALAQDERFEGPIPVVLKLAADAIRSLQPSRRFLGTAGRFVREGLVPDDVWLEGLVNAVVHRSYSLGGDHIRVDIFDDRIEIESPGRFPGLVTVDDPRGVARFARNPRIARVCADLDFGQELGEGIRRMFAEMRMAGLDEPGYRQTAGSTVLTLSGVNSVPSHLANEIDAEARQVLDFLRVSGRASTGDVADATGFSRPTAGKRLRQLRDVGLIVWDGKSAKDPRATWRLNLD